MNKEILELLAGTLGVDAQVIADALNSETTDFKLPEGIFIRLNK